MTRASRAATTWRPGPTEIVAQIPVGKDDKLIVVLGSRRDGPRVCLARGRMRADGRFPMTARRITFAAAYVDELLAALERIKATLAAAVPVIEESAPLGVSGSATPNPSEERQHD